MHIFALILFLSWVYIFFYIIGFENNPELGIFTLQQGKIAQAEKAIKTLYGKERVAEVMANLNASGQGSSEPEAGWFDLFSARYWKGTTLNKFSLLYDNFGTICIL